jgi:uncharacterized protein VirK/YbjX
MAERGLGATTRALLSSFSSDRHTYSTSAAAVRFLRLVRQLPHLSGLDPLLASPSATTHQRVLGVSDPYFSLSHEFYLCKYLGARERILAATQTYEFIDTQLSPEVVSKMAGSGHVLFRMDADDHTFDIRLMLGNDNIYEGGLSAVFHVDGQRVCVMSFAIVDGTLLGAPPGPAILICRNQTTFDRWYQEFLQGAFKHVALHYLTLAGLAGIGLGLGLDAIYAVTEDAHPHSLDAAQTKTMAASYSLLWGAFLAEPCGRGIVKLAVPLESKPLDQVSANHRRRAKGRREIISSVSTEVATAFAASMRIGTPRPADPLDQMPPRGSAPDGVWQGVSDPAVNL